MIKRNILLILVIIIVVSNIPHTVYAGDGGDAIEEDNTYLEDIGEEPQPSVQTRNTYVFYVAIGMSILNGKAVCYTDMVAYASLVTETRIYMYLEKYNSSMGVWETVTSWNASSSKYTLTLDKSIYVGKGTYRLKGSFWAFSGTNTENIIKYSNSYTK